MWFSSLSSNLGCVLGKEIASFCVYVPWFITGPMCARTLTYALQTYLMQSSQHYYPISHLKKAVMREFQNVSKVSSRAGFKLYFNDTSQWPQSLCCPSLGLTALPCETVSSLRLGTFFTGFTARFQHLPSALPDTW